MQAYQPATSMNSPVGGYGEPGDTVGDHIADDGPGTPEDLAQARSLEQDVNKVNIQLWLNPAHSCVVEKDEAHRKAPAIS